MKPIGIICAVRDDSVMSALARELESEMAADVRIVSSGYDAVTLAREIEPDILIVDAVLPQIDGLGVVDELREMLRDRMPMVIGGSMMAFSDEGFRRRGVCRLVRVPWQKDELASAVDEMIERLRGQPDFDRLEGAYTRARELLLLLGMRQTLHGFTYLAWAGALAYGGQDKFYAVGKQIYEPIAGKFGTTPQNVERLIRHAVERTMDDAGANNVYGVFGNSLDPARGKPTNAQMIAMVAQRLRVAM